MPSSLSKENLTLATDLGNQLVAMIKLLEAVDFLSGIGSEQSAIGGVNNSLFELESHWINAVIKGDGYQSQLFL